MIPVMIEDDVSDSASAALSPRKALGLPRQRRAGRTLSIPSFLRMSPKRKENRVVSLPEQTPTEKCRPETPPLVRGPRLRRHSSSYYDDFPLADMTKFDVSDTAAASLSPRKAPGSPRQRRAFRMSPTRTCKENRVISLPEQVPSERCRPETPPLISSPETLPLISSPQSRRQSIKEAVSVAVGMTFSPRRRGQSSKLFVPLSPYTPTKSSESLPNFLSFDPQQRPEYLDRDTSPPVGVALSPGKSGKKQSSTQRSTPRSPKKIRPRHSPSKRQEKLVLMDPPFSPRRESDSRPSSHSVGISLSPKKQIRTSNQLRNSPTKIAMKLPAAPPLFDPHERRDSQTPVKSVPVGSKLSRRKSRRNPQQGSPPSPTVTYLQNAPSESHEKVAPEQPPMICPQPRRGSFSRIISHAVGMSLSPKKQPGPTSPRNSNTRGPLKPPSAPFFDSQERRDSLSRASSLPEGLELSQEKSRRNSQQASTPSPSATYLRNSLSESHEKVAPEKVPLVCPQPRRGSFSRTISHVVGTSLSPIRQRRVVNPVPSCAPGPSCIRNSPTRKSIPKGLAHDPRYRREDVLIQSVATGNRATPGPSCLRSSATTSPVKGHQNKVSDTAASSVGPMDSMPEFSSSPAERRDSMTRAASCFTKSSSSPPASRRNSLTRKAVSFSTVSVYVHPMVLGDNPSVSYGLPVTMAAEPIHSSVEQLEDFEGQKEILGAGVVRPRTKSEMKLSPFDREQLLKEVGHSDGSFRRVLEELKAIRASRRETKEGFKSIKGRLERRQSFLQRFAKKMTNNKE